MLVEVLVGTLVVLVVWLFFLRGEEHPIDKLPSPPTKPIIGNTMDVLRLSPDKMLYEMVEFTKLYGDRFVFKLITQRILNVSRPSDVEVVMSHSKNIKKSKPYEFVRDWLGDGLLLSTGAHWHMRRKILTPTFHFNILKSFAVIFEESTMGLVELLKRMNGEAVDILPLISDFTLFAICETAMGTKLGKEQTATTKDYKNAIQGIGCAILYRMTRFWLHNDFIFSLTSTGKDYNKTLQIARAFAEKVIDDRRSQKQQRVVKEVADDGFGPKKRLAMLDLLLEAEEKGQIDLQGIRDEVNTFMFEGHDTTAAGISFALMLLADHEEIQERIYEEVHSVFGDSDQVPTTAELAEMKYLEAVIKETLRLYPSVPFIGREITEDFMMGGILVKKGTTVDVHIYELHHREDMFPNPQVFDPERFLGTDMKHPYAYVPFSAGPRNCIGQRYAMLEMKLTLGEICRNFKLVPKTKGARPRLASDLVLRALDPIYIKFVPR